MPSPLLSASPYLSLSDSVFHSISLSLSLSLSLFLFISLLHLKFVEIKYCYTEYCVHWKDWSWNSNTLATSCEELTHWKRPWCWEGLGSGGEGDDRGWDGWMASPTRWAWVWVNSRSLWWTGRPGVLRFMGSQRVRHNWVTELKWTDAEYSAIMKMR